MGIKAGIMYRRVYRGYAAQAGGCQQPDDGRRYHPLLHATVIHMHYFKETSCGT
jgi:hypothetical protein